MNLARTKLGIKTPAKSVMATRRKLCCVKQARYQYCGLLDLVAKPFVVRKSPLVRELLVADRTNVIPDLPDLGLKAAQFHDQATLFSNFDQTGSHVQGTGPKVILCPTEGGEPLPAVEAHPSIFGHWISETIPKL